jgi:hypothetical protein
MATGDFVAASVGGGAPETLRIADAICGDIQRAAPEQWVARTLARFQGAQVVAARTERNHSVVAVRGPGYPAIFGVGGRLPVLLCAAVGYAWLVSDWPLTALEGLRLAEAEAVGWHGLPGAGTVVSYELRYRTGGALPGPSVSVSAWAGTSSSASSRWTWSASGAPASSNRASAWVR